MNFTKTLFIGALLGANLVATSAVQAWGTEGHQIVAQIASKHLTPQASQSVQRLLAAEPGETLASVSTWADEHRNPATAAWHYVNFPRGDCLYQKQRECPDGKCVVEAIQSQAAILGSAATDEKRLLALKYLVHLVADVHQPLHAGYQDDRGGNTYQLQAFMRGSNLHAVWDSGLIKQIGEPAESLARRLGSHLPEKTLTAGWTAEQAAMESCRIVETEGFYPGRLVTVDYLTKFTPVAEARLTLAGARLAQLLNTALR